MSYPVARYPNNIASASQLKIGVNNAETRLVGRITAADTIITVRDASEIEANMLLSIDSEIMSVSSVSGNNITVTRGYDDTTAESHASNSLVQARVVAWHHNSLAAEVIAIQTALGTNLGNTAGGEDASSASQYNFAAQQPGGSLIVGANTITLTPVPSGVNGGDTDHYLYISGGTGTAEAVKIIGGSAVSGAASGTVIVTCANTHSGAWTIRSASAGIYEGCNALGWVGTLYLPIGTLLTYGPLILRAGMNLTGEGNWSTKISSTVASGQPAIMLAHGPEGFGSKGMSSWRGFSINAAATVAGSVGLWLGGDPAGTIRPNTEYGSFIRLYDVTVDGFDVGLKVYKSNFASFVNCTFGAVTTALYIVASGDCQPIEFYGCTVTTGVSTSAVILDNGFADLNFFGGQVSGTISGAGVNWRSMGTHYEPNDTGAIATVTTSGTLRIIGGLISLHPNTTIAHAFSFTGAGFYTVQIDSAIIQTQGGTTVTDFLALGSSIGGTVTLENLQIVPAGTFTNIWTLTGSTINLKVEIPWTGTEGYDNVISIASASSITFPRRNFPNLGTVAITGVSGTITSVAGLRVGEYGTIYAASEDQTFSAGATIGNTKTLTAGVPYKFFYNGAKIWFN
jgi:hypothetical protein